MTSSISPREHNLLEDIFGDPSIGKEFVHMPSFDRKEVVLGKLLGRGSFSDVVEIKSFVLHKPTTWKTRDFDTDSCTCACSFGDGNIATLGQNHIKSSTKICKWCRSTCSSNEDCNEYDHESRRFIAEHCTGKSGEARYAIKGYRKSIISNPNDFRNAIIDFALEARFLASLKHPNIIKLRGRSNTTDPYDEALFLVLDRLYDTLNTRISKWSKQNRKLNTVFGRLLMGCSRSAKKRALLDQRVAAAYDLTAAVKYLHSKSIIHRDIKPCNIGFDIRGDIKLFDFGMARILRCQDKDSRGDMFHLSHMTGSLRYMAPEVALGKTYNSGCDVYSLCTVIWEMIALQRVYGAIASEKEFIQRVFCEGHRPGLKDSWSSNTKDMLTGGWAQCRYGRFNCTKIEEHLLHEIMRLRNGDDKDLGNHQHQQRRRSTYIFEGFTGHNSIAPSESSFQSNETCR